ncbi:MAG: hypothetical protein ACLTTH_01590 [Holdemanella porci]
MQKYVEIKRDGLTLRGMLHVPDNVSSESALWSFYFMDFVMIAMK